MSVMITSNKDCKYLDREVPDNNSVKRLLILTHSEICQNSLGYITEYPKRFETVKTTCADTDESFAGDVNMDVNQFEHLTIDKGKCWFC